MIYQVEFTNAAEDDLSRLDRTIAQQAMDRVHWLADNADIPLIFNTKEMK